MVELSGGIGSLAMKLGAGRGALPVGAHCQWRLAAYGGEDSQAVNTHLNELRGRWGVSQLLAYRSNTTQVYRRGK